MFHKVKEVSPLPDFCLSVVFVEGVRKIYNMTPLIAHHHAFAPLKDNLMLFNDVKVDAGGYGISWNDDIDLSCNELYENGQEIETPFTHLMSFADATELWGLNESTLRKAVAHGKLVNGIDANKYGKQWIVTLDAMLREYGEPEHKKAA